MKVFGYIKLLLSAGLTVLVILSSSAARSEREALSYDDFIAQYGTQRSESDDEFIERREALILLERQAEERFLNESAEFIENLPGGREQLAFMYHQESIDLVQQFTITGDPQNLRRALDAAGNAIRLDNQQAEYWINLGLIHTQNSSLHILRSAEYAEDAFVEALSLNPEDPTVMTLLAERLFERGAYEEALFFFETAIVLEPTLIPSVMPKMVQAYLIAPFTLRGAQFLYDLRFMRLSSPEELFVSPSIFYYSAILHRAMGDYDQALSDLRYLTEDPAVKKYVNFDLNIDAMHLVLKILVQKEQNE